MDFNNIDYVFAFYSYSEQEPYLIHLCLFNFCLEQRR